MRIAISADTNDGLDSVVGQHFGRCPFFVIVDLEDDQVSANTVVQNPFYGQHQPGQVPGFVQSQGVEVMLTRSMGGRAIHFFEQLGIAAATGATGSVREALASYLAGELQGAAPCKEGEEHGHGHH